jgi:hypothetical protein
MKNPFVKFFAVCTLASTIIVSVPETWLPQRIGTVQASTTIVPGPRMKLGGSAASDPIGYPNTISGLVYIWTADSITTLNDGDPVSTWVDLKSGNVATASGTARPTWRTNAAGAKPALVFDGTTDTLSISNTITLSITSGFTVIGLWSYNGGSGTKYLISKTGAGAGGIRIDTPGAQWFEYDGTAFPSSNPNSFSGTNAGVGFFRYSSGNKAQFRQNISDIGNPATALVADIGINVIGSFGGTTQFFLGNLESLLIYSRELTATECGNLYTNWHKVRVTTLP